MSNPEFIERKNYYGFKFINGFIYEISKYRCKNERQLNEWIGHLEEKIWWSKELEEEFIKAYKNETSIRN